MVDTVKEVLARLESQDRQVDTYDDVRQRLRTPRAELDMPDARMRRRMREYCERFEDWEGGGGPLDPFSDASLYHNFAEDRNLNGRAGPVLTFSRASGAMQYDETGRLVWGPENLTRHADDFTQTNWVKRGTATVTGTNELSGIGTTGNDIFDANTPTIQAGYRYEVSFLLRAVTTNGIIRVTNPNSAAQGGEWHVDLSQISTTELEFVDRTHPSVTIVVDFKGTNAGGTGLLFQKESGPTDLHFFCSQIQTNRGTFAQPFLPSGDPVSYGPRFDYDPATLESLGLLIEQQRTNSLLQSRAYTTTPWVTVGTTSAAQDQTGSDGVANAAWTLGDTDAALPSQFSQQVTIANNNDTHCAWFRIGKVGSAPTVFPEYQLVLTGGVTQEIDVQINLQTGATNVRVSTGTTSHGVIDEGNWWLLWMTVQNNTSGNLTATCSIFPAIATTLGGAPNGTLTGTVVMDYSQFEQDASFPSSTIPTTTAAVIRSADVCNTTDMTWLTTADYTMFSDWVSGEDTVYYALEIAGATQSDRSMHAIDSLTLPRLTVLVGNVIVANLDSGVVTQNSNHKMASRVKASDYAVCLDGGTVVTQASGANWAGPIILRLGDTAGGARTTNGHHKVLAVWGPSKPDDFLKEIST